MAAAILSGLLIGLPPARVNADSNEQVYLVLFAGVRDSMGNGLTSLAIPVKDLESCEAAGIKMLANNKEGGNIQGIVHYFRVGFDCVVGIKK